MIGLLPAAGPLPEDSVPIDARTRAEYEAGHVPGAIHLAWEEFCVRAPTHAGEILRIRRRDAVHAAGPTSPRGE